MTLDYAPDGKSFCTGGKDNIIRIYDEETKKISHELKGIKWHTHGHSNRIFSVKYSPDDPHIIASGGWDQNVKNISRVDQYLGCERGELCFYNIWTQNCWRFYRY